MKWKTITHKAAEVIIPRLGELLFVAIFAAIIGLGPRMMNVDGDLGRHISLGNYIIDSRSIPTEDVFSFTKTGDPLTPHEWLADVLFALMNRFLGLNGIVWMTAVILAGAAWLVYRQSLNLSNMSLVALLGGILGAAAASLHWLTRPHIFTIFFVALWTGELEKIRIGVRKNWIIFPLMMLVWVNLHGAFLAGLLIWLCYFVGNLLDHRGNWHKVQPFLWIGLSSFLVSLANPDGIGIWKTGFGFLGNRYLVSHTAEYLPPDFQSVAFWPFLLLIFISIVLLGLSQRKLNFSHLFLVGGWTAMALYSARNIPLYVATTIPVLCEEAAGVLCSWNDRAIVAKFLEFQEKIDLTEKQLKGGLWTIVAILLTLILFNFGFKLDFQKSGNQFSNITFPVEAVDWLEQNPPIGNGFNYFPWGGYLLYRSWPERLVFIDGQTDFYGEKLTREYERVITLNAGWEEVMSNYEIDWAIMPKGSDLITALKGNTDWQLVYQDQTAEIMMFVSGH